MAKLSCVSVVWGCPAQPLTPQPSSLSLLFCQVSSMPPQSCCPTEVPSLCTLLEVSDLVGATSWEQNRSCPGAGSSGEELPGDCSGRGEAPVGGTRVPFWEETVYHPLSLAASQGFLPPVSLLILLIYLKELRKRRGAPAGAPHRGSDTRPPRLPPRGTIQRGPNLIFLQIVCQKQQGK